MNKKAVILLSGGLDSATCLAYAKSQGFDCYALSFIYGQRALAEIEASKKIGVSEKVQDHKIINLDSALFKGSALTNHDIDVPESKFSDDIPITYVPARNTIFLSIALGFAEVNKAHSIFIGANKDDYSCYPDCRQDYLQTFEQLANLGTKEGVELSPFRICAPLLQMNKSEIILLGNKLGVDYSLTVSCYQSNDFGQACGKCSSCILRARSFSDANVVDPTIYY